MANNDNVQEIVMATNDQNAPSQRAPPTCSLCQQSHYYPECEAISSDEPETKD